MATTQGWPKRSYNVFMMDGTTQTVTANNCWVAAGGALQFDLLRAQPDVNNVVLVLAAGQWKWCSEIMPAKE